MSFEKLSLSLVGGSLDAHGMTVAGDDRASPVLTVARIRAEVAVTKVLKGEVVIKSLTVQRPVLSVVRRADGRTNLPRPPKALADAVQRAAADREAIPPDEAKAADPTDWRFDARKLLLVDGSAEFRDESPAGGGTRIVAERILGELTRKDDDGYDAGLVVDAIRREGGPTGEGQPSASLGPLNVAGRLAGAADLSQLAGAKLTANLDLAGKVRVRVDAPSLASKSGKVEADADLDLATLMPLVRPIMPALQRLIDLAPRGRVQVQLRASYSPDEGLRVPELLIRATDVSAAV